MYRISLFWNVLLSLIIRTGPAGSGFTSGILVFSTVSIRLISIAFVDFGTIEAVGIPAGRRLGLGKLTAVVVQQLSCAAVLHSRWLLVL